MNAVFVKVANMSVSAAWLILVVIVLRLVLRRAPRWITCLLWAFVAVRLVCPFSLHSPVSAYQVAVPEAVRESGQVEYFQYVHAGGDKPSIMLDISADEVMPDGGGETAAARGNPTRYLPPYVAIWLIVGAGLLVHGIFSTVRLRYRMREAVRLRENIWVCDAATSPFLLGVLRPRIYLPSGMVEEEELRYVLAHEQAHLRRGDHIWKPLGYLLLAIHWFDPLVWVAYWLFCRDIETACDQRVVRTLDAAEKKAYSTALLSCSQGRRMVLACPVAFGEVGVKSRIKSVLHYKKPAVWVIVAAVAVCIMVAVCFLTDPLAKEDGGAADSSLTPSEALSGTDGDSLQEDAARFPEGDFRWSYESGVIEAPYMTVNGGGTVFYVEVPDELARRIRQRVAENVTLSGFTAPQFTNGWQRDLISWSAEKAEVHLVFAEDYSEFYTLCRGETRLWGLATGDSVVEADGEVRELLAMIAALTGWETNSGREAFTGLTAAELVYNGKTIHTVTDAARLGSLQNLLQNGTQASFASKTPMERVELRMTRSDGTTVSVLLDTDSPRIFLPPFYYYEYNDYESTETLPLLEALGLTAWPKETEDMDCSPWLNERLEALVPLPAASEIGGASLLTEEQAHTAVPEG